MLDLPFKGMALMISYVEQKQRSDLVQQYDLI